MDDGGRGLARMGKLPWVPFLRRAAENFFSVPVVADEEGADSAGEACAVGEGRRRRSSNLEGLAALVWQPEGASENVLLAEEVCCSEEDIWLMKVLLGGQKRRLEEGDFRREAVRPGRQRITFRWGFSAETLAWEQ